VYKYKPYIHRDKKNTGPEVVAQCKLSFVVVVVLSSGAQLLHPLERSETQNLEAVLERLTGGPEEQHARLCHVLLPTHHPQDPVRRRDGVAQILS
jgi:hypothetical protein